MSDVSKSLMRGALEALEYAKGHKSGSKSHKISVPAQVDVQEIRKNCHMSREEFSNQFGFSIRTLEKWERGERTPEGPTRAYLTVIARNPAAVVAALQNEHVK